MEDNLSNFSEEELQALLRLADNPEFRILQRLHRLIMNKMVLIAFNRVDITDEDRKQHAIQLGHAMAWEKDEKLKAIVNEFLELKSKKKKLTPEKK